MSSRSRTWLAIYARALRHMASVTGPRDPPRRILLPHHSLLGDTILLAACVAKLRARTRRRDRPRDAARLRAALLAPAVRCEAVGWDVRDRGAFPRCGRGGRSTWPLSTATPASAGSPARWARDASSPSPATGPRTRAGPRRTSFPCPPSRWPGRTWSRPRLRPAATALRARQWEHRTAARTSGPGDATRCCTSGELDAQDVARRTLAGLASALEARGLAACWSAGPGEEPLVAAIPGAARQRTYAGRLDLAQLWDLVAHASLV